MRFKEYIQENVITLDGVEFDLGVHFLERLKERSELTKEQIDHFLHKIREHLAEIGIEGEFLFYSRKLKQGIVAVWDAFKSKIKMITFLPRGKDFPKPGTDKVVVESKSYTVIYVD
jgi:hypothetical protein